MHVFETTAFEINPKKFKTFVNYGGNELKVFNENQFIDL